MDIKPKVQKKAWIYNRTNTADQDALRLQVERLADGAKQRGYTVTGISYDEESQGEPISCPGLQLMLEAVQRGEVDVVMLAGSDQIHHLAKSPFPVLKFLHENGVYFYIQSTSRSETPPTRHKRKGGPER